MQAYWEANYSHRWVFSPHAQKSKMISRKKLYKNFNITKFKRTNHTKVELEKLCKNFNITTGKRTNHQQDETNAKINQSGRVFACSRIFTMSIPQYLKNIHLTQTDKSHWIKPKSDYIFHFPIDFYPNGLPFGYKSIGKW